jgi:ElaB/YqjD/DUF883 family membrane-anchored ribosome-binding protein
MSADALPRSNGNGDTGHDIGALSAELAELRDKVEDLNGVVEDYLADVEHGLVQNARRIGSRVWEAAEHDADAVIEEIEQNPITALAIAFGLGAIVGLFVLSRR